MGLALVRGTVAAGSCDITPGHCLDRMVLHDICSVICNDGRYQAAREWRIVIRRVRGQQEELHPQTAGAQRMSLGGHPELMFNR
jgi:hypothetical protein